MTFKALDFTLEAETRNVVVPPNNITYDGDFCIFFSEISCSTFLRITALPPNLILSTNVYWCALLQFSFYYIIEHHLLERRLAPELVTVTLLSVNSSKNWMSGF